MNRTECVNRRNAWFTDKLRTVQKERDALYKIAKRTSNNSDWLEYRI